MPRSKYPEIKDRCLCYQRSKKKTLKATKKLIGSLLYLLNKLNEQLDEMEETAIATGKILFRKQYKKRRRTIKKVYIQQKKLHETGERSKGMIVSIMISHFCVQLFVGKKSRE